MLFWLIGKITISFEKMSICSLDMLSGANGHVKHFTHLFRPPADSTLFISIFRHLGEEETVEEVNFALSLFRCSFHEQCAVKVDDFVIEPLFRTQQLELLRADFFPVALGLKSGVFELSRHLKPNR